MLGCVPHMLPLAALVATTAVHTCSWRSLQEESKANPVIEAYAVVQILVTAEAYVCRTLVADRVCLVHLATVGACASASLDIVDSVSTVVADKMRTVHGRAAVEVYCSANYSVDLQTNVQSVDRDALSALREVVVAGKSLGLLPAAVDPEMYFVGLLDDIEHPLQ